MHLGIIGYGNIAQTLMELMRGALDAPIEKVTALSLPDALADAQARLKKDSVGVAQSAEATAELSAFIGGSPDLVVECAGHGAVSAVVPEVLLRGIDTIIVSIGALADAPLEAKLRAAAKAGGGQIILPAGAVGGVDILSALRPAGITSVTYKGRKPPHAWAGTPAEDLLDLEKVDKAVTFFTGNARDAAQQYPKNANVAATLALGGIGFEATQVELIADPAAPGNLHEYSVESSIARYSIQIENKPSAGNAKTSVTTAYSVLRAVINREAAIAI